MPTITWRDRLFLERAVWAFDRLFQDPPRKSRIAKRSELRDNLRSATEDVGVEAAVRQLGDLPELAGGYRTAEYGDWKPRPSWTRAGAAAVLFYLPLAWLLEAGSSAFRTGVLTASQEPPAASPGTASRTYSTTSSSPSPTAQAPR